MQRQRISRRTFLEAGAVAGAGFLAPLSVPSALGQEGKAAPSERIELAVIGIGGRGRHDLGQFLAMPGEQVVAVCDVDKKHLAAGKELANKQYGNTACQSYSDFRELLAIGSIDAVCIATPDHWHALIAVAAANAGKDVYCESPLANSVGESRAICKAIKSSGRILQCGCHERSNPKVRYACELVRQGHLGDLKSIRIQMPTDQAHHDHVRKSLEMPPAAEPPEGFNYDFWLGPTPKEPYSPGRCHFWWRFIHHYGGGEMTDRGSHILDIAQLAGGKDGTGPSRVWASGERNPTGLYDAFMNYEFVYTYDDGLQVIGNSKGPRGLRFEGTKGSLFVHVHGGNLEADPKSLLDVKLEGFDPNAPAPSHHQNFIDCVKSRQQSLATAESAHRTATICHLINIAMTLGRELRWDPQTERILDDAEANRLLFPPMREPWML